MRSPIDENIEASRGFYLYRELIRRLRAAGASGATALRGIWGSTATTVATATTSGSFSTACRC